MILSREIRLAVSRNYQNEIQLATFYKLAFRAKKQAAGHHCPTTFDSLLILQKHLAQFFPEVRERRPELLQREVLGDVALQDSVDDVGREHRQAHRPGNLARLPPDGVSQLRAVPEPAAGRRR